MPDRVTYSAPLARSAMAYVLAGGRGARLMELTDNRAKPAVYFGGKTRIIDFALSNALNSGHPPYRGRHAIQGAQPDPPPAARLELPAADAQRKLRHPARVAARDGEPVVHGHGGRGVPEHRHHRRLRARLHRRPRRRPRLQDGLRAHARAARQRRRRRHGRMHRGEHRGRARPRRDAGRRIGPHRRRSSKSPTIRRSSPASPAARSRAWASTCSAATCCTTSCAATPATRRRRATSAATSFPISSRTRRPSRTASSARACAPVTSRRRIGATSARSTRTSRPMSTSPTSCPSSTSTTASGRPGPTPTSRRRRSSCTTSTAGAAWGSPRSCREDASSPAPHYTIRCCASTFTCTRGPTSTTACCCRT